MKIFSPSPLLLEPTRLLNLKKNSSLPFITASPCIRDLRVHQALSKCLSKWINWIISKRIVCINLLIIWDFCHHLELVQIGIWNVLFFKIFKSSFKECDEHLTFKYYFFLEILQLTLKRMHNQYGDQ